MQERTAEVVKALVFAAFVVASLAFCSSIALSFPENIRLGYPQCGSCHVAPSGGGALTNYGRSTSEELASWSPEGGGNLGVVLPLPEWFAVGGDVRYIKTQTRSFLMQRDLELGVRPAPYLWLVASGGEYGEAKTRQLRRVYALWSPTENLSLQAGRFTQSYGVKTPDHTIISRRGLGQDQGSEHYGAELSWHGSYGELTASSYVGAADSVNLTDYGYKFKADNAGATARAAATVGKRASVGWSYRYDGDPLKDTLTTGPFVTAGLTRDLYLLAEAGRAMDSNGVQTDVAWGQVGYELVRGVHLRGEYSWPAPGPAIVWQLLPIPHWELYGRSQKSDQGWSHTLLAHYWL